MPTKGGAPRGSTSASSTRMAEVFRRTMRRPQTVKSYFMTCHSYCASLPASSRHPSPSANFIALGHFLEDHGARPAHLRALVRGEENVEPDVANQSCRFQWRASGLRSNSCQCCPRRWRSQRGPNHLPCASRPADVLLRFVHGNCEVVLTRISSGRCTRRAARNPVPADPPPDLNVIQNTKVNARTG